MAVTITLITIVLVVAGGWLLYREPPKQRPGEALGKFDRLAQRLHDLVQSRWYGKVAGTMLVLFIGLLASQLISSDSLTASTKTATVTVTSPTGSTPSQTTTTTEPQPQPQPKHSVLGTWTGIVVDQDDSATKYQVTVVVQTTRIDTEVAGTITERSLGRIHCVFDITATRPLGNAFTFYATENDEYLNGCIDERISVERKTDETITYKSDHGNAGTLHRG
jgi:hypothetical protein